MTKIHVGIVRKVGQANYGSIGAECRLEIDTDSTLLGSPDETLPFRIQHAFDICRQEVDRELQSASPIEAEVGQTKARLPSNGHVAEHRIEKRPTQSVHRVRPATDAQVRAIHAIASKAKVQLASQLHDEFGVASPSQLTIRQASDLIESLKSRLPSE
jgi:hypothetical protein